VVGLVEGEVVAVATATLTVNVPLLTANFDLEELLPGGVPPLEQHVELNACIINPIFSARGAAFLEGEGHTCKCCSAEAYTGSSTKRTRNQRCPAAHLVQ
jgi:hypothetical protein